MPRGMEWDGEDIYCQGTSLLTTLIVTIGIEIMEYIES